MEVYLTDIDVAKWYDEEAVEDTHFLGTQGYAAPEQYGLGFEASSEKTDIYAVGMVLNKMLTGKFPKEVKAAEDIWPVIEKCISLDADNRYSVRELLEVINGIQ